MNKPNENVYLLMNQASMLIAQGLLTSDPEGTNLQFRIIDGLADDVEAAEVIQAVPVDTSLPVELGQIIFRRGNLVVLEPLQRLGREVRRNLRVPVDFQTLLYPLPGGRAWVTGENLSCGGIAFRGDYPLTIAEQCEIVIPITLEEPLLLTCQVLRHEPGSGGKPDFYAAKFVDLINDQETVLRAAVFSVQLRTGPGRRARRR